MTREECVTVNVSPRASDIVARVTINGAILRYPAAYPLISPKPAAAATVTVMPTMPASSVEPPAACMAKAPAAPENATTEPTDRSIPPVSMIIVIAIAANALEAACLKRFMTVLKLKKPFETNANNTNSTAIIAAIVIYRKVSPFIAAPRFFCFFAVSIRSRSYIDRRQQAGKAAAGAPRPPRRDIRALPFTFSPREDRGHTARLCIRQPAQAPAPG